MGNLLHLAAQRLDIWVQRNCDRIERRVGNMPDEVTVCRRAQVDLLKQQFLSTNYVAWCGQADKQPMGNATRPPIRFCNMFKRKETQGPNLI